MVDRGIALSFIDLGARRGWVVSTTPRPLYPRERPGTHCTGGWVDPRAGLDVCEKSHPNRDSIPGPSYTYIYIYIAREDVREREGAPTPSNAFRLENLI